MLQTPILQNNTSTNKIVDGSPSTDQDDKARIFNFHALDSFQFKGFHSKPAQENLYKWGMVDQSYMLRFTYDQYLQPYQLDRFLMDFFNDPVVNGRIRVYARQGKWGSLGKVSGISKQETVHTVTSLSFFDRLYGDVVRSNGDIKKCLDEYVDGFVVSDHLRKCLIMKEDESYLLFNDEERKEFIFHLFKALCLGGKLCQFEDTIKDYFDATKVIYKDLICVTKDSKTGNLQVASHVFKIEGLQSTNSPLFPIEHPQNFCYVSIDPVRRHVNLWYHASDVYYQ